MRLTKNERACLEGARRLAENGEHIGATSAEGAKAIKRLADLGLLRLVGFTASGTPLYDPTLHGCSELSRSSSGKDAEGETPGNAGSTPARDAENAPVHHGLAWTDTGGDWGDY